MPRPKISFAQVAEAVVEKEIATSSADEQPVLVIACGGFTEAVYFQRLTQGHEGVRVQLLTPLKRQRGAEKPNLSSPLQTVERALKRLQVTSSDSVWVVLDIDHHFDPTHLQGTLAALQIAKENGYSVVFSNPCFEVWLLMHTNHVLVSVPLPPCEAIEAHLRKKWGFFQKTNFDVERLRPRVRSAIAQSRANPNVAQTPPTNPSTQVHLLLEALDLACGETKLF